MSGGLLWRAAFTRLDGLMRQSSRPLLIAIAAAATFAVALADYVTGYDISLAVFYLVPVAIVAWYADLPASRSVALVCAACRYGTDHLTHRPYSHAAIPVWNALVIFGFLLVSAILLSALRELLQHQRQLVLIDALTCAFTRRALEERLGHDLELAGRRASPLSIAYVDIDDFKTVNDSLGHGAGDRVLRAIANVLLDATRRADTVARMGGDEFAIVLPDTGPAGAREVLGKVQAEIARAVGTIAPQVTCSIGVITFENGQAQDLGAVLDCADRLMYEAKRGGKNQALFRVFTEAQTPVSVA